MPVQSEGAGLRAVASSDMAEESSEAEKDRRERRRKRKRREGGE